MIEGKSNTMPSPKRQMRARTGSSVNSQPEERKVLPQERPPTPRPSHLDHYYHHQQRQRDHSSTSMVFPSASFNQSGPTSLANTSEAERRSRRGFMKEQVSARASRFEESMGNQPKQEQQHDKSQNDCALDQENATSLSGGMLASGELVKHDWNERGTLRSVRARRASKKKRRHPGKSKPPAAQIEREAPRKRRRVQKGGRYGQSDVVSSDVLTEALTLVANGDDCSLSSGSGSERGYQGSSSSSPISSASSPFESSDEGECSKYQTASNSYNAFSDSSDLPDFGWSSSTGCLIQSSSGSSPSPLLGKEKRESSSDDAAKLSATDVTTKTSSNSIDGVLHLKDFGPKVLRATQMSFQKKPRASLHENFVSAVNGQSKSDAKKQSLAVEGSTHPNSTGKAPFVSLGCDMMAHCLSFLEPPDVYDLLMMPLSKDWRRNYTMMHDLWRVLCLSEPFNAKTDPKDEISSGDESVLSTTELEVKHLLGRYRLLYGSFVRCMRYLKRIKADAQAGRAPTLEESDLTQALSLRTNESLKSFLARARGVVINNKRKRKAEDQEKGTDDSNSSSTVSDTPIGVTDETSSLESAHEKSRKSKSGKTKKAKPLIRYGHSQLTQRLLGPSRDGEAGNVNLPWSCAIYSIVNWMVAFSDVVGIQTMCLKVLPFLLEDESQRTTAQRAGLTDIVLRAMVLFPESIELHTSAFHTIVLLARPLGGREGMLFHSSMVNSSGIFNKGTKAGKNGIAVMLDSMKRFQEDEILQAMSCWSLVNVALAPSQKTMLVKLGGISVVANAMIQHPQNSSVQFRALFALINLVIPSVGPANDTSDESLQEQLGDVNRVSEKDMLDESVSQIANLVVSAMKNFCSSESILNRACLVLHNMSLTEDYIETLLWTPNCYQMLEWCLANYRTDRVLQQSAGGTLHRLQATLTMDEQVRTRFTASLQSQNQMNLERVHREALRMHEQQARLERTRNEASASRETA